MASTKNRLHNLLGVSAAHHGRETAIEADDDVNLEVINLGLSRTGTTSICAALEMLGFAPGHQGIDLFRSPARNAAFRSLYDDLITKSISASSSSTATRLVHLMRGYRSSCDHPINHIPEIVVNAYPHAKYILATREGGAQAWWTSFENAVGVHFRRDWSYTVFRALIWPVGFIRRTDDLVQTMGTMWRQQYGEDCMGPQLYDLHNSHVKGLLSRGADGDKPDGGNDRLLIYNVKEGWGPLCEFLGVPVPDKPFPLLNERESMKAIYLGMQVYGALVWTMYAGIGAGSLWLAMRPDVVREAAAWTQGLVSKLFGS